MAHPIQLPRLGWSMEPGTFIAWLKRPGEAVAVGEPLFEMEGEKALQQIESTDAGILHLADPAPSAGQSLPVGALLGWLLAPGESPPATSAPTPSEDSHTGPPTALPPPAAPSVRRLARELGVVTEQLTGSGQGGRILADDVRRAAEPTQEFSIANTKRIRATPRARRFARERNIDLTRLVGSGRMGRIRQCDVEAALTNQPQAAQPLSARRLAIIRNLQESLASSIPVTLHSRAEVTKLAALRALWKTEATSAHLTWNDLVVYFTARAIADFPIVAQRWNEDRTALIPLGSSIDIGIAVDTPHGLVVPVLRDCLSGSLRQRSQEAKNLIEKARSGRLTRQEIDGGCLTVSNLGHYGVDTFTPIIHTPQIAIIGIGAIRREPALDDQDRVVSQYRMGLSLTFDHAAIDGAQAACFLQKLADHLRLAALS
ncbi:MAG: dihydrolipoamide acetyltransferase family protein [Pirellulaceae bacterium]